MPRRRLLRPTARPPAPARVPTATARSRTCCPSPTAHMHHRLLKHKTTSSRTLPRPLCAPANHGSAASSRPPATARLRTCWALPAARVHHQPLPTPQRSCDLLALANLVCYPTPCSAMALPLPVACFAPGTCCHAPPLACGSASHSPHVPLRHRVPGMSNPPTTTSLLTICLHTAQRTTRD
ncbi:hypothetical protein DENSPDRAFT_886967 [Dentipellis sp. KUC8613]|nr:hypothetical protein DENSPDRAFT_886967 [Dentipellis sp. KUC8613]